MGTRNLTAVMHDGKYKIAQYGQWDGYPSGQGATALEFCRKYLAKKEDRNAFAGLLGNVRFASDEEIRKGYESIGVMGEWVNQDQNNAFHKLFPYIDRDHGAEILELVAASAVPVVLQNSIDFAGDSLFCEWAYVIDLDKNTFEVYSGFNEKPLDPSERFANAPPEKEGSEYYPIRHVVSYSLDDLPSKDAFLKAAKKDDEDDE